MRRASSKLGEDESHLSSAWVDEDIRDTLLAHDVMDFACPGFVETDSAVEGERVEVTALDVECV
jgi:hypothetical protein